MAHQTAGDGSVLVVILNWNSPDETLAAVRSVLEMDYEPLGTVIIDNGSTDDSMERLAAIRDARVRLIHSETNRGFTGGCNLGIELAREQGYEYVWLLNSDAVVQISTLSSLVKIARSDPKIGMVSPLIASLQEPSRFIYAGGYFNDSVPSCESTRKVEEAETWSRQYPEKILLLGTALLIKMSLVEAVGPLDEQYFAYWEDMDLSMRSNKAGFRNAVDFGSVIFHSEKFPSAVPEEIKPHFWYYLARNEIRFWKKHTKGLRRLRCLWWAWKLQCAHLQKLKSMEASQRAVMAGIWHGWTGRRGAYSAEFRMPHTVAWGLRLKSRGVGGTAHPSGSGG